MVFSDVLAKTYDDSAHSHGEQRYVTLGMSDQGRVLVVAHTMRGETVRIISARKATKRERKAYEEKTK
ncbi:MAG: BrnT family toxin [Acidobacteriota bacterium]